MNYAAYLTNTTDKHDKHYFIQVDQDAGGHWQVRTAWGRIGRVQDEKTYTGGKTGGPFAGERNAEAYAKAIFRSRLENGYVAVWTHVDVHDWSEITYSGVVPGWWTGRTLPTAPAATPKRTKEEKVEAYATAYGATPERIAALKKMAAAGAVPAAEEEKQPEEKVTYDEPKPRYGFKPRSDA